MGVSCSPAAFDRAPSSGRGRLLGYRWPTATGLDIELTADAKSWVRQAEELNSLADEDGIVCIPSVRGERPAHERLLQLLHAAYGDEWNEGHTVQIDIRIGQRFTR